MPGSFEGAGPSISADDLDSWMSSQPRGQNLLVAAQQDLDGSMSLKIHEQRSRTAGLKRPIIDPQDPRRRAGRCSTSTQQVEQGCRADGHGMSRTKTRPCLPS